MAELQVPEPWSGDLEGAPILFLSSNPCVALCHQGNYNIDKVVEVMKWLPYTFEMYLKNCMIACAGVPRNETALSAEVVTLLEYALEEPWHTQAEVLDNIRRRRFFEPKAVYAPDSTTLLRQDRER